MWSLLVPSSFERETEAAQRAFDYLISDRQTGNEKERGETCEKEAIEGHFLFARVVPLSIFHSRIFFFRFCLRSKRSQPSEELLSCSRPSEELLSYSGRANTITALRSLKRLSPGAISLHARRTKNKRTLVVWMKRTSNIHATKWNCNKSTNVYDVCKATFVHRFEGSRNYSWIINPLGNKQKILNDYGKYCK